MPPRKKTTTKSVAKSTANKAKRKVFKSTNASLRKVKKILDGNPKMSSIIMFEQENEVKVTARQVNPININVVEHPLDQYSSPHVLDLSSKRYIERVRPSMDGTRNIAYRDLPAGELLDKLQIFELLSIENSEIIGFFRKIPKFTHKVVAKFKGVDMSPKLPLASGHKSSVKSLEVWQEVSLINFILFCISLLQTFFSSISQIFRYGYDSIIGSNFGNDEEISLSAEKVHTMPVEPLSIEKISLPISSGLPSVRFKLPKFSFKFKLPHIELPDFSMIFRRLSGVETPLKSLVAFAVAALFVAIPIRSYFYIQSADEVKGKVLGQAEQALFDLSQAKNDLENFNFVDAQTHLSSANNDFVSAQNQLQEIKSALTVLADTLPLNNTYRSGKNLLDLGEKLTKSGEYLVSGINQLSGDSELSLVSRAKNFKADMELAVRGLEESEDHFNKIKISHLPEEHQSTFAKLKDNLPVFVDSLKKSESIVDFAINFFGDNDLKRYLVVFQNDNELRATGGFMGSYALVDFKGGDISDIKMPGGGTYDVRAGFKELLASPEPMRLINPRWEFQDANWWPDFPTSAQNIAYFYNKSDGATIDGVIVVNSDWLGDLLSVVGSIDMPEYNKTITADNFEDELQKSVEIESEDKKQPKKILGDLAPKLLERIFDVEPTQMMNLVTSLKTGLDSKDIMIYLFDDNDQKFVSENNWDGRMKDSEKDYLSVVATNIGGGKTDGIVDQQIYHKANILSDGSVIDSVLIKRSHFGPVDEHFTNQANRSYLRVYVPLGSELISAQGFIRPKDSEFKPLEDYLEEDSRLVDESSADIDSASLTRIYKENNKTVYGNWLTINPGESKEILLVYKLPFKVSVDKVENLDDSFIGKIKAAFSSDIAYDSYSLLVQKQSGSNDDYFSSVVEYPSDVSPYISYPDNVDYTSTEVEYGDNLTKDLFYFVGFKKDIIK